MDQIIGFMFNSFTQYLFTVLLIVVFAKFLLGILGVDDEMR